MNGRHTIAGLFLGLFAMISVGANCQTIKPPEGPGTSYPCGIWGVECPDKSCCPYKHICGGRRGLFTTCPEGYCCYAGGDDWPRANANDAGLTRATLPDGGAP